jgi:hypothetical protein
VRICGEKNQKIRILFKNVNFSTEFCDVDFRGRKVIIDIVKYDVIDVMQLFCPQKCFLEDCEYDDISH